MFPGLKPTAQCVPRWKEHSLCQSLTKFAQILSVMSCLTNFMNSAVYYIDLTFLLVLIRHVAKVLIFHCRTLNNILYCDDTGIETSHNTINGILVSLTS